MKSISRLLTLLAIPALLTSCLKRDLPEANSSSLKDISDFNLIYKYADTVVSNAGTATESTQILVRTIQLNKSISISNDTIYVTPTFPAGFPRKEKIKVSLKKIWGYANIPDAATITPIGGSPELGKPGDFSVPASYEITAADGSKKKMVVAITPLPIVNQWEGIYIETGTLSHASAGLQTSPANYTQELVTVASNKLKATAAYWYFNNTGITYFITINPDNTVTLSADPNAVVSVQQENTKASTYNPTTKTFQLYYYYYSGGDPSNWRRFETTFTLK